MGVEHVSGGIEASAQRDEVPEEAALDQNHACTLGAGKGINTPQYRSGLEIESQNAGTLNPCNIPHLLSGRSHTPSLYARKESLPASHTQHIWVL